MSQLLELESAAAQLPPKDRQELLVFLALSLRRDGAKAPTAQRFAAEEVIGWLAEDQSEMQRFVAGQ